MKSTLFTFHVLMKYDESIPRIPAKKERKPQILKFFSAVELNVYGTWCGDLLCDKCYWELSEGYAGFHGSCCLLLSK